MVYPPPNYYNDTSDPVDTTFECNATDNDLLTNISLYITNNQNTSFALNQTTIVSGQSNSSNWTLSLNNGDYTWNCLTYDSSGNYDWDINRTILIDYSDSIAPIVVLNYPPDNYNTTSTSINFNWTATDNFYTNLTCNLIIDSIVNASNILSLNGTPTNYTVLGFADKTYYWNVTCLDTNNNANTSETRIFTIDTTGPTCTIVSD